MSLIKLASVNIKSCTRFGTCLSELNNVNSYNIGIGVKDGKSTLHAFGETGKNRVVDFTNNYFNPKGKYNKVTGQFDGRLIERTNKDAKRFKNFFKEIYKFKSADSMKRFRSALKLFD